MKKSVKLVLLVTTMIAIAQGPASAGLLGLGGSGGVLGTGVLSSDDDTGLGTTVTQTTDALGNVVNSTLGTTTLGDAALAKAVANVSMNKIVANVDALPQNKLVKLCISVGGGAGCGTTNKTALINLVNNKIALLPKLKVLNLCVSVGSSCGVASIVPPTPDPGPRPGPAPQPPGNHGDDFASLSDADIKKLCIKIMGSGEAIDSTLRHYCLRHSF